MTANRTAPRRTRRNAATTGSPITNGAPATLNIARDVVGSISVEIVHERPDPVNGGRRCYTCEVTHDGPETFVTVWTQWEGDKPNEQSEIKEVLTLTGKNTVADLPEIIAVLQWANGRLPKYQATLNATVKQ